jgi:Xaa-Pro aminopeptidase
MPMKFRVILSFVVMIGLAALPSAQIDTQTSTSGGEALRLIRNNKLDLILPGAMRDNKIDMWIHVTREGDPDPLAPQFGSTYGYLVFTDRGNKIERAVFGSSGAVENIDVRGSDAIARALSSYGEGYRLAFGFGDEVYDEFRQFVAERDPKTIAVNMSEWLAEADGMSHSSYVKLVKLLGPKYSGRMVSAEKLISDFIVRRTLNEVTAQANALEMGRRLHAEALARIVPGRTSIREITTWAREWAYERHLAGYSTWSPGGVRVYYSAVSPPPSYPPSVRYWAWHGDYVLQRGDFFAFNVGVDYLGFGTDTKTHAYILREGETKPPDSIQRTFDLAIAGQRIMRDHMKVGMTAGQSLKGMIAAMEKAGYVHTPFDNSGIQGTGLTADGKAMRDYATIQKALANTDTTGFEIDNHAFGSFNTIGPSMTSFRADRHSLTIQENHIFAFEYMIHRNIPERPGFPLAINISNVQIISSRGVEWLQPPNERIVLIH